MASRDLPAVFEMAETRGSRKHPNRWKWSDKLPHSPLSSGTSRLNPWTFFELAHLFVVSLTNQSADFCLGLERYGAKFQIVEGIISLEPKTLGDPDVTCCRWTRFGLSACQHVWHFNSQGSATSSHS